MLVYFDKDEDRKLQSMGRVHPWTETTSGSGEVYVDFKERPDLIECSLPDLEPVRETAAGSAILDFMRVINGPDCAFETNDFGAKPIRANISNGFWPLEHSGRVTILLRDLELNTRESITNALVSQLETRLKATEPEFKQACWGLCRWPHVFAPLETATWDDEGDCICLMWWSWGHTDDETADNTARAFQNLKTVLLDLSRERPWTTTG